MGAFLKSFGTKWDTTNIIPAMHDKPEAYLEQWRYTISFPFHTMLFLKHLVTLKVEENTKTEPSVVLADTEKQAAA